MSNQNPGRGRPQDPQKTENILKAASKLFLRAGLQRTSMDKLAAEAGVSKQTLYTHFKNKDDIFRAVIKAKVKEHRIDPAQALPSDHDIETILSRMGHDLLTLITDREVVDMFRVVIGESRTYPKIAKLFYESGPDQAISVMARQLEAQMKQGTINQDDPRDAAALFSNMCKGELHMQLMMGLRPQNLQQAIDLQVQNATTSFLAIYRNDEGV